jgi:Aminopeptidase I zinc metalloprotease (M18)
VLITHENPHAHTEFAVDRTANDTLHLNKETQLVPILGLVESQLNNTVTSNNSDHSATSVQENHHPELLALLAQELSVAPEEIHDFELSVNRYHRTFIACLLDVAGTSMTFNQRVSLESTTSLSQAHGWTILFLRELAPVNFDEFQSQIS